MHVYIPQLSLVDELYHQHGAGHSHTYGHGPASNHGHHKPNTAFGTPQACSTPDHFKRTLNTPKNTNQQGSYTCNDIQLHGVKWSTEKNGFNNNNNTSFECSENPCPPQCGPNRQANNYPGTSHFSLPRTPTNSGGIPVEQALDLSSFQPYASPGSAHPRAAAQGYFSPGDFQRPCGHCVERRLEPHYRSAQKPLFPDRVEGYGRQQGGGHGVLGMGQGNMDYGHQGSAEITKMTFTPRQMMETHLSQLSNRHEPSLQRGHSMSEMDISSIYPKREFIERAVSQSTDHHGGTSHSQPRFPYGTPTAPPKKRHKMTNSPAIQPIIPPQMPIIDDMIAKCPTPYKEINAFNNRGQKYHVLNPSDTTSMPSKVLLCKYIDFLILENEQITEISKSPSPPEDIYVTEDMYFMDSLKYRIPFPSKKLTEWVSSFYPKLNFWQMTFKREKPKIYPESVHKMVDNRSTQQILEDTFYFFQREITNYEGQQN